LTVFENWPGPSLHVLNEIRHIAKAVSLALITILDCLHSLQEFLKFPLLSFYDVDCIFMTTGKFIDGMHSSPFFSLESGVLSFNSLRKPNISCQLDVTLEKMSYYMKRAQLMFNTTAYT
jgi:hypothetical protein